MKIDLYQALGLPREADAELIRGRCMKLKVKYHPDKHPHDFDPFPGRIFRLAGEAERVLCNEALRAEHDRALDAVSAPEPVPTPAPSPAAAVAPSAPAESGEPSLLEDLIAYGAELAADRLRRAFRRKR